MPSAGSCWQLSKGKQAVTFLKKSNQKTFAKREVWPGRCQRPQEQKFFLLLFVYKKQVLLALLPT
jgi:hypothetical protein